MKIKNIFDKKYVIITHRLFTGAGQDLYRFLKKNSTNYVLLVQHSFSSVPNRKTTFSEFKNNKQNIRECLDYKFLPDLIVYAKDFLYSFFGILFNRNKFDLIVGCGGFNALSGLLLKWMGKSEKVVFYTIDFAPRRFDSQLLNKMYHKIDYLCVKYCDKTWNVSPRIALGREKLNRMFQARCFKQEIVPIGVWMEDYPLQSETYKNKTVVFIGHLIEEQGLQLVIKALPKVIENHKDFQLIVIGAGDYETQLKKLGRELNLGAHVIFKGAINDKNILRQILGKAHLGIAMYKDKSEYATAYYADSTKIKSYLAMGLPVILSDVPHNAKEIEKCKCGKVIPCDVEAIAKTILELVDDEEKLKEHSKNCLKYIQTYEWNKIFADALSNI